MYYCSLDLLSLFICWSKEGTFHSVPVKIKNFIIYYLIFLFLCASSSAWISMTKKSERFLTFRSGVRTPLSCKVWLESLRWRVHIIKMALSLGIIFGIVAMLAWGIGDFFVAKAVRKSSVFKAFIWAQIVGLTLFLFVFLFLFEFPIISFTSLIMLLIAGILGLVPLLAYYKGLQIGTVSIISPIAASYAVIPIIYSLIFLNEKLTVLQTAGVILAILGAILTSFKFHDLIKLRLKNLATGVEYGLIAMVGWGVFFIFIDSLVSEFGWFLPVFLIKALVVFYVLVYSGIAKKNISFPKNVILFVILIGVLESIGFLALGGSVFLENISLVAPVTSVYPAVTIILARIFFKEILELNQKLGVISVLVGLVVLAI